MNWTERLTDVLDNQRGKFFSELRSLNLEKKDWFIDESSIWSKGMTARIALEKNKDKTCFLQAELTYLNKDRSNGGESDFWITFSIESENSEGFCFWITNSPYVYSINSPIDFDILNGTGLAEIFRSNSTLLVRAAKNGHLARLERLLEYGFDVNSLGWSLSNNDRFKHHTTPLTSSIQEGRVDITRFLLEGGALADIKEKPYEEMWDPLFYAVTATERQYELVKFLLQYGASPLSKDEKDRTPVSMAASREDWEILDLLQERVREIESEEVDSYVSSVKDDLNAKNISSVGYQYD
ncbi:MAG: ankyrin repeat domain-containing protein [Methyloprofundus sp.]|nr:ankyrin repeat domain-containing protein [Methyloprofundus sp.]